LILPAGLHDKVPQETPIFAPLKTPIRMCLSPVILGMLGPGQITLIVVALLLLFGGKKIPELMRGLGQGMKEFKDATKDDTKKDKDA
jgi:sec-independent protein translocase protein TatA